MLLVVYFTSFFLFCHQTEAAETTLTASPSDRSFAIETRDFTLVWEYTLDGSAAFAQFVNITGGGSGDRIARLLSGSFNVDPKYQDRFTGGVTDSRASLTIRAVKSSDQGKYRFTLSPSGSGNINDDVEVIVQALANFTNVSRDATLLEGQDLHLFCIASGRPDPNITWVRISPSGIVSDVLHRGTTWDFKNISRAEASTYRCIASNGVEDPVSHTINVTVIFSPEITLQNKYYVGRENSVSLDCKVEGYPPPTITWTPCDARNVCDQSVLNISKVLEDFVYICKAKNSLGSDCASTKLLIGAKVINLTLIITSKKCSVNDQSIRNALQDPFSQMFENESAYRKTTVMDVRCGNLIVDLRLMFSSSVTEKLVLDKLREAVKNGKFGDFSVNTSPIRGTQAIILHTNTLPFGIATQGPPEASQGCSCSSSILIVLMSIFAGIIVVQAVCLYLVHKKGKTKEGRLYATTSDKTGDFRE